MPKRIRMTRDKFIYAAFVALAISIVMGGASFQYANYVDRKNKQQWCTIVVTMDDAYKAVPPSTTTGKTLAREFARMRAEFNCKK